MSDTPFIVEYPNGEVHIYPPTGEVFGIYRLVAYGYGEEIGTVEVTVSTDNRAETISVRFKGNPGNLRPLWMHAFNAFVEHNIEIIKAALDQLHDRKHMN